MEPAPDDRRASWPKGVRALYWSDYVAHCSHKAPESRERRRLLALPRLLVNPSLQAVLVLRIANASPRWTWWIWRNFFVRLHSMDWSGKLEIGPGFEIPHPIGVLLAADAQIGANVGLGHNVTLAGERGPGRPIIEDNVTVYPGSVLMGGVRIGEGSIVGANCVVTRDVPPGRMVTPRGVVPLAASNRHGEPGT
ncbi:serine acetyltransferase [Conexibacter sp. W3-3-2]|uniref:Serine acetyltransferase n=1 Tax=Paraconexibacter algicola TaxID=2133960 RepID=A0A2T4UCF0_9ACTN|nr:MULTISPECIES: serine acetyltransferase [Solirubrobacterales]MTD43092.1 serine acetyltransferase [Conexibacter sp. W3-3-2]PTL54851.1 serine acetyltransferase [Paraconexibacter algicola]